jgi:glycine dehydrogenase subunit 2
MIIFEISKKGRRNPQHFPTALGELNLKDIKGWQKDKIVADIPGNLLRQSLNALPEVSELQTVRHYTQLSRKNFSIDSQFYPLGSCTMKYNPRAIHKLAALPGFLARHPLASLSHSQGFMRCAYELQEFLKTITGMQGVCLTPMAGAQGELAGVLMIRAYHQARGESHRNEMLVPDSAHGTNPASAVMSGYKVKEIPTDKDGDLNLEALERALSKNTAGIMLTNPSTLGLFERNIQAIEKLVHVAGGLLYYDGANLNAILGKVRPGDMGFDVMHMNLHKTFATPHGGGGPGAGPVAVGERLLPYLPIPRVGKRWKIINTTNDWNEVKETDSAANGDVREETKEEYVWLTEKECPETIGRLSSFMGNAGIILRAYLYIRMLGREGLHRVSEFATLHANYLLTEMKKIGFTAAYPKRLASHEFVLTLKPELKSYGVNAMDFAKRILDFNCHAPTTYFPLLVPECWLIEPTETESKEELDHFIAAMQTIREEAKANPEVLKNAPHTLPVKRLDDIKAARDLDVGY